METPKPETLMWLEFLWRVAREAPEMLLSWIAVYIAVEELRARKKPKTVDLGTVNIDSRSELRAILGIAIEHDQALPIRAIKRVTLGIATEADTALPLRTV